MIRLAPDLQLHYVGPELDRGPLPALFYFALSAEESLRRDPYNQPVVFLNACPLRIFSIDLPSHGPGLASADALSIWAKEIHSGYNLIRAFTDKIGIALEYLLRQNITTTDQIGLMGLSRGSFIAAHVAARHPFIRSLLGFAPLTQLSKAREFQPHNHPLAEALDLTHLIDLLSDRTIRFYIGNRDVRVSTSACFHFVEALADAAFHQRIRSSAIELLIGPSIGHQGHGTSKETFQDGARWIAKQLGIGHV